MHPLSLSHRCAVVLLFAEQYDQQAFNPQKLDRRSHVHNLRSMQVLTQRGCGAGVGLRTLYLPGLQGLKEELRMLDWLMERLMPQLKQHLEVCADHGHSCIVSALHSAGHWL